VADITDPARDAGPHADPASPLAPRDAATLDVRVADAAAFLDDLPAGSVDLVYLDPPFATGRDHVGRGRGPTGRSTDRLAWSDREDLAAHLDRIGDWIERGHRVLRSTGSILLHVDWRTVHHLRLRLDAVFGAEGFVNHLVWHYGLGGSSPRRFARKHDDILFYGRSADYWFDPPRVPATSARMRGRSKKATDVLSIPAINNMARERTGWPTQKPRALLDLLVRACAPPGGLVADPACGSGTALVSAAASGRRWAGGDRAPEAVEIARRRLAAVLEGPDRPENA